MEWCQVVKLPSATISCFFCLLFIERKRQGLIFEQKPSRSSGVWADMATTISVMRLNANGCT
nr:MAG TPA: hypothetical protein [Caudoviricetes sp.]